MQETVTHNRIFWKILHKWVLSAYCGLSCCKVWKKYLEPILKYKLTFGPKRIFKEISPRWFLSDVLCPIAFSKVWKKFLWWMLLHTHTHSKAPPLPSCQVPSPLNLQTVQALFSCNLPYISYMLVFHEPSLKIGFFTEPQNIKVFYPSPPSYFLKIIKFLVKISQFEFLFIIEKNIFVYKLFSH